MSPRPHSLLLWGEGCEARAGSQTPARNNYAVGATPARLVGAKSAALCTGGSWARHPAGPSDPDTEGRTVQPHTLSKRAMGWLRGRTMEGQLT